MPEIYSVITTAGIAAAIDAGTSGPLVEISGFRIGANSATEGAEALETATSIPGVVYVGDMSQIGYSRISDDSVCYTISLEPTVGNFNIGTIGLFMPSGDLFSISVLPRRVYKYQSALPEIVGNRIVIRIILRLSNIANLINLNLTISDYASLPEVPTEAELPSPSGTPYSAYLVRNHTRIGSPSIAVRREGAWYHKPHYTTIGQGEGVLSVPPTMFQTGIDVGRLVWFNTADNTFYLADPNAGRPAFGRRTSTNHITVLGYVEVGDNLTIGSAYYADSGANAGRITRTVGAQRIGVATGLRSLFINTVSDSTTAFATIAQHIAGTISNLATHPRGVATGAQMGQWIYAPTAGTATALTLAIQPEVTSLQAGATFRARITTANTGASTLRINALAAIPIVRRGGSPTQAGDLTAGSMCTFIYDGTNFQFIVTSPDISIDSGSGGDEWGRIPYTVATGTANALLASFSPAITSYFAGLTIEVRAIANNTGSTTINVQGLGVRNIVRTDSTALRGGDIQNNMVALLVYDGTAFQLIYRNSNSQLPYAVAGGTANAITAAFPGVTSLYSGLSVLLRIIAVNTGTVTLNANSIGAVPIIRPNGTGLEPADLAVGNIVRLVYSAEATSWYYEPTLPENIPYAVDTGTVNNLICNFSPAVTATRLRTGFVIATRVAVTNTDAVNVTVNGMASRAIVRRDGSPLVAGDLVANQMVQLIFTGTNYQVFSTIGAAGGGSTTNNYNVSLPYIADSGSASNLIGLYSPAITTLTEGNIYLVKAAYDNAGPSTLRVNALTARPITHLDGTPLVARDISAGMVAILIWDGSAFQLANRSENSSMASGRLVNIRVITSTTTYTAPAGIKNLKVHCIGGGGSGAIASYSNWTVRHFFNGRSGSEAIKVVSTQGLGTVTCVIGAGGSAAGTNNYTGNGRNFYWGSNGGATSFGSHCVAPGGFGNILVGGPTSYYSFTNGAPDSQYEIFSTPVGGIGDIIRHSHYITRPTGNTSFLPQGGDPYPTVEYQDIYWSIDMGTSLSSGPDYNSTSSTSGPITIWTTTPTRPLYGAGGVVINSTPLIGGQGAGGHGVIIIEEYA